MLLPLRCPACHTRGPAPCTDCIAKMRRAGPVPLPTGLDDCRSLLLYEGPARPVITGVKYRNDRAVLGWLADGMAGLLRPPQGSVVTWAPTTGARRRSRGFDQAELLAVRVARRWSVPCVSLLRRGGTAQTGRSRGERRMGAAITARGVVVEAAVRAPAVVVVDDVVTTGATLAAAAAALRATGIGQIIGLTAARTPSTFGASYGPCTPVRAQHVT